MKKQINSFYLKNATDFLKNGLVDIVKQHSDNIKTTKETEKRFVIGREKHCQKGDIKFRLG